MIKNLAAKVDFGQERETDVLIIGAGIAGLVLAAQLRKKKLRVVILESGDRHQTAEIHPLNRVVELGAAYSGASHGRFRCIGGTSTRWGGALIPFVGSDLAARPYLNLPGFPVGLDELDPYLPTAEKIFGVDDGSYNQEFLDEVGARKFIPTGDQEFITRFAKWPPFKRRNLANVFDSIIQRDPELETWINATATRFNTNRETGRVNSVTATSVSNRTITIKAKQIVVCAGAIESTRLLLLLNRESDERPFCECNTLGRFFYDHISMPLANIRPTYPRQLNRLAGFRFCGSTMRSLRFELASKVQKEEAVGNAFCHISFKTERVTGFDVLRDALRSVQRGAKVQSDTLKGLLRELPFLVEMGWWRILHRQLLWPIPAVYELHVVAEQLPQVSNYISLSDERDCLGVPLAAIRWQVAAHDFKIFSVVKRRFAGFWRKHGLEGIGELVWHEPIDSTTKLAADVYHPGGSTRMGTNRHSATVNADLRLFALTNLWVSSTSCFPSGGGENPTLMLILFTLRLADKLERELRETK